VLSARRALLIDDSPLVLRIVRDELERAGFSVDTALDGDAGVERAVAAPPDVIVCDLSMPGRDGLDTIRSLKQVIPSVPIVVLTEQNEALPAVAAMRLGAAAWVRKGDDLLGPVEDAVDRRRAELAQERQRAAIAQASSDTLNYLLDHAGEPMLIHRHGLIVRVNPPLLRCFGIARADDVVGRPLMFATPEANRSHLERTLRNSEAGKGTEPVAFTTVRIDGSPIDVEATTMPIVYQGEPASLGIIRDLTARRRHEANLVMTDRLSSMGLIAAGVAHEINNPLAYLFSNLNWLDEELGERSSSEVRQVLHDFRDGLARIRNIVADLKGMSRDSEVVTNLDVRHEVELAMRMASPSVRAKADLVAELCDAPPVKGRPNRLTQVFLNLFLNAAQAMAERRPENRITVSMRVAADSVAVEVADNGPGMPREVVRRLFQPFFTTKPAGIGTGLGLSISKTIVESCGGAIAVASSPGAGTQFTVVLPVAP
jgi:two-component system, NtrC family, sensor kinase